ncbi:unnamed protein product, partial [Prorocentrum cordatum]
YKRRERPNFRTICETSMTLASWGAHGSALGGVRGRPGQSGGREGVLDRSFGDQGPPRTVSAASWDTLGLSGYGEAPPREGPKSSEAWFFDPPLLGPLCSSSSLLPRPPSARSSKAELHQRERCPCHDGLLPDGERVQREHPEAHVLVPVGHEPGQHHWAGRRPDRREPDLGDGGRVPVQWQPPVWRANRDLPGVRQEVAAAADGRGRRSAGAAHLAGHPAGDGQAVHHRDGSAQVSRTRLHGPRRRRARHRPGTRQDVPDGRRHLSDRLRRSGGHGRARRVHPGGFRQQEQDIGREREAWREPLPADVERRDHPHRGRDGVPRAGGAGRDRGRAGRRAASRGEDFGQRGRVRSQRVPPQRLRDGQLHRRRHGVRAPSPRIPRRPRLVSPPSVPFLRPLWTPFP